MQVLQGMSLPVRPSTRRYMGYSRRMAIERINPEELGRPSGFSHAVSTSGERIVFLAGQTALDSANKIVGDGVVAQFERALGNLLTALRAAGGEPADLV